MRLLQLCGLATLALLVIKLATLAANGAFDELAVSQASAQDAGVTQDLDAKKPVQIAQASTPTEGTTEEPRDVTEDLTSKRDSRTTLLTRLGDRRQALDQRERDLKLREELLAAAERRLKAQIKKLEREKKEKVKKTGEKKNENAKDLIVIYENMKPKDAAKIFNELSISVLYDLASAINPRKMSSILAEMDVKAAERLTVEMAHRAIGNKAPRDKRKLEKIGG